MSETKLEISFKTLSKVQLTAIAARLQLSTDEVLGKCVRLWLWAKINSADGFIASSTFATLDESFRCPGFASALESVDWLRARAGGIEFPNFDRLAGGSGGTKSAARMRRLRERKRNALRHGDASLLRNGVTPRSLSCSSSGAEGSGGKEDPKPSKAKIFVAPTLDEVTAYCRERGNKVDPGQFVDHYQANGWVQASGQKIRDWKAAVRTWEKRDHFRGGLYGSGASVGSARVAMPDGKEQRYLEKTRRTGGAGAPEGEGPGDPPGTAA